MVLPPGAAFHMDRTLLGAELLLLHLLDEQVEHLRLEELLDKVPRGLGVDGLVEAPLLENGRLAVSPALHVGGVVADGPHEEVQEGLGHHTVQLLSS